MTYYYREFGVLQAVMLVFFMIMVMSSFQLECWIYWKRGGWGGREGYRQLETWQSGMLV